MTLLEKIQKDMVVAMKAHDQLKLDTLRSVKTALDRYRVDNRKPVDEKAEQQVLNMLAKQRQEAAEAFTKGGRTESAEKELAEKKILESYMPSLATEEEVTAAIETALSNLLTDDVAKGQLKVVKPNPGLVMKAAQALLAGKRVDNKALMEQIRAKLS